MISLADIFGGAFVEPDYSPEVLETAADFADGSVPPDPSLIVSAFILGAEVSHRDGMFSPAVGGVDSWVDSAIIRQVDAELAAKAFRHSVDRLRD